MKDKAIIMGISLPQHTFSIEDKDELMNLCAACDIEVVGLIEQNLERVNSNTFVGPGKITEVVEMAKELDVKYIIANHAVSARMMRSISKISNSRIVLDRNMLVLEIFTRRAKSKSAQIQVEIAKINYELPRLIGSSDHLSRQGGSTGGGLTNRGPGETKLEIERRSLNKTLQDYKRELIKLERQQQTQMKKREDSGIYRISLVGYTNAGKSTVMNQVLKLANSDQNKQVFAKDMLFATLDTSTRKIDLAGMPPFLLSDTVGFVNNLPHQLIEAFKSTLQEVVDSDLLVHVIDASSPNYQAQRDITINTLNDIGAGDIPMIEVYNKGDRLAEELPGKFIISALSEKDIERLIDQLKQELLNRYSLTTLSIDYHHPEVLHELIEELNAVITSEDDLGYTVCVLLDKNQRETYKSYLK